MILASISHDSQHLPLLIAEWFDMTCVLRNSRNSDDVAACHERHEGQHEAHKGMTVNTPSSRLPLLAVLCPQFTVEVQGKENNK